MTSLSYLAGLVLVKHLSVLENPADICPSHTHLGQFGMELGDRHKVLVVMLLLIYFHVLAHLCFMVSMFLSSYLMLS